MTKPPPAISRKIVAANVRDLMNRQYIASRNRAGDLAKDAGCSLSSVQRVLKASSAARVDTLEALARALGVQPYQLFIPNLQPFSNRPEKTRA